MWLRHHILPPFFEGFSWPSPLSFRTFAGAGSQSRVQLFRWPFWPRWLRPAALWVCHDLTSSQRIVDLHLAVLHRAVLHRAMLHQRLTGPAPGQISLDPDQAGPSLELKAEILGRAAQSSRLPWTRRFWLGLFFL